MKSLKVRFQGVITENAVFRCCFYMLIVIAFRQAQCADSPTNGTKSSLMLPSTASWSKLNDNFYSTNNLQVGPISVLQNCNSSTQKTGENRSSSTQ